MGPTPHRQSTDIGGGRRGPQLRSCRNVPKTAILARGPRALVQRTPLFPHIVLPGRQVGGGAPQQLQIMGSLPHGVSPGISLSLGDDWCGQVHREHWRLGRWREASPAYFSAQPLGPKLQTPVAQSSTGPPLLSLAL